MKPILVTGAGGQLGKCLQKIHANYPQHHFIFTSSDQLDITDKEVVFLFFEKAQPDYCINGAAYTNVEQAEKEPEKAFSINAEGVKNLAEACKKHKTTLFHISTDYVFDGKKATPYTENDAPNPINQYGASKLAGEKYIREILHSYFIIRTSWLYSEFGKNFYKTILEKAATQKELYVTDGETGCPTNANDLMVFLMKIITNHSTKYGIYNFCGNKVMTWYDFAQEILQENNLQNAVSVNKTKNYPTFAARPVYSVLQSTKNPF